MCGIIGIVTVQQEVNQLLYDGLTCLQHRGQDAAGIVTCDQADRKLHLRKSNGLVRDVFLERHIARLRGRIGIGHVRYPTAGTASSAEAQPFYVNYPHGICLAHNGNLTNAAGLAEELHESHRHTNTNSDSEVLLNILAQELQGHPVLTTHDIFAAVEQVHLRCEGAYSAVSLIAGKCLLGFRDPHGIRPLLLGRRVHADGTDYMFASESAALQSLGFELVRDVAPGEAIIVDTDGHLDSRQCAEAPKATPCIFEYVYLARPDSVLDTISVYKTRLRLGEYLAEKILREWPDHQIDVVIPIPDTSCTSALSLAGALNVPYREGFVKNRYIGRTFIMPGQAQRQKSVRQKLNTIELEFKGKNVLLLDDSIVRGTTSRQIIQMARDANANKVYFASASPPIRYPNVYGIDMPCVADLIAAGRTECEIAELLQADGLIYQDLPDLIRAAAVGNPAIAQFETSIFDGTYPAGDITEQYLAYIERLRAGNQLEPTEETGLAIHNN